MKLALFVGIVIAFSTTTIKACDHAGCTTAAAKASAGCCKHDAKAEASASGCPMSKKSECPAMKSTVASSEKCPSCGEKATKKIKFAYEGTTYHFCCKDCLTAFKANPSKYLTKDKS